MINRVRGTGVYGVYLVQCAVDGECAGLTEPFAALRALERLLFWVDVPASGETHIYTYNTHIYRYTVQVCLKRLACGFYKTNYQ